MIHTQSYKTGGTPLYWASLRGHIAVVKLLLESGADLNILDEVATHKYSSYYCIVGNVCTVQNFSRTSRYICAK